MRAFWNAAELFDRAVFGTLDRIDKTFSRASLTERTNESLKDVKEPQRVITFEK